MLCPRCRRESSEPPPPFCGGCGAPLRLPDDPSPGPLDVTLDLDRRRERAVREPGAAGAPPARPPLAPPAARAPAAVAAVAAVATSATSASHWDMGRVLATGGEPAGLPGAAIAGATPAFGAPLAPSAAAPAPIAVDGLPEPEVDALEIHLRRPAGWRRAAAGALDALPFAAGALALVRRFLREATAALPAPPTGVDGLLDLVAREWTIVLPVLLAAALALFVYATLCHALAGATLGKRLLGLRLVASDGERPSLGRSAARSALAVGSAALLGTGFLLALFTRSGRALHDLAASTWVVEAP